MLLEFAALSLTHTTFIIFLFSPPPIISLSLPLTILCRIVQQTGCMGCASGKNAGPRNIFGNKYGQNLAAVQIAREKRLEANQRRKDAEAAVVAQVQKEQATAARLAKLQKGDEGDEETDDEDDDDDYGPAPSAGIWAGSQKLQQESERIADAVDDDDGEEETDDDTEKQTDDAVARPSKKVRTDND